MGRPKAEKPLEKRVTVRFSVEEYQKLEKIAARRNLTITQTIRKGVEDLLESRR